MVNRSAAQSTARSLLQQSAHLAVALLVVLPSISLAADGTFSNELTGSDSQNTNAATDTTDVSATFSNTATVDNSFTLNLNTGGNTIQNNTTVGDVTTGDVSADIESTTTVNEVDTDALADLFGAMGSGSLSSGSNATTGSNSQNTNQFTNTRTFSFTTQNTLNVTNNVTAAITTGNNAITDNTTVGNITTGDIDVDVNVTTQGNGAGGGLLPDEDTDNGGGSSNPGPVTIAQLPPTQISAAPAVTTPKATSQGGGFQFFPAGSNPQIAWQLVIFALVAVFLVRFQELSPLLFSRLQHHTVPLRVQ